MNNGIIDPKICNDSIERFSLVRWKDSNKHYMLGVKEKFLWEEKKIINIPYRELLSNNSLGQLEEANFLKIDDEIYRQSSINHDLYVHNERCCSSWEEPRYKVYNISTGDIDFSNSFDSRKEMSEKCGTRT
jgi:hypothetical protein